MSVRSKSPSNRPARLDFRLDAEAKQLIEQAAAASGQTVSDFAVSTLVRHAHDVLDRQDRRRLSDRDRDRFLDLLERDERPNDALQLAARTYKRSVSR